MKFTRPLKAFDPTLYLSLCLVIALNFTEEWFIGFGLRPLLEQGPIGIASFQSRIVISLIIDATLLFVFFRESLLARPKLKVVYGFLFSVATVTQYCYYSVLGRYISSSDFSLLGTSSSDLQAALHLCFSSLFFIPAIIYAILLICFRSYRRRHDILAAALCFCAIVVAAIKPIKLPVSSQSLVGQGFGGSVVRFYEAALQNLLFSKFEKRQQKLPEIQASVSGKNVVVIIDESIRADHLSINGYSRDTTPYLRQLFQSGYLSNFGTAVSGATCSPLSNAMLITGTMPSLDSLKESISNPTIFQYGKALNYRTTYIDAQSDILWTGLTTDDLGYIDRRVRASDLGDPLWRDYRAAKLIRNLIATSDFNLIVLNKKGVHFMYEDNYPTEAIVWSPLPPNRDYLKFPNLVKNSYDNGVLFAVDNFFKELLSNPSEELKNTTIIYTSDHSQTLIEHGETWSHCNFKPIESAVPLFLLTMPGFIAKAEKQAAHFSVLPTALSLMGVTSMSGNLLKFSLLSREDYNICPCFLSGALNLVCSCK